MSAFEVTCTPPRPVANRTNEAREPTLVLLGPFTPKATVVFEGVPVGKTARRLLIVRNTNNASVQVNLAKVPHPECGLSFEWTSAEVEAGAEKNLELVWNPQQLILGKEVVILIDSIGNKKEVQLVLKAIELKSVGRKAVNKSFTVTKKLKLKSPSPPKVKLRRNVLPKRTKTSPLKKAWSTVAAPSKSRMGSFASKGSTTLHDSITEDSSFDQSDLMADIRASPIDSHRMGKENINPTSPVVGTAQQNSRAALTPKLSNDSYRSYIANQPTPDCYNTFLKPYTGSSTVVEESETKPRLDDNLQRHLTFSPDTLGKSEPEEPISLEVMNTGPGTYIAEMLKTRKFELDVASDVCHSSDVDDLHREDDVLISNKTHPVVHGSGSQLSIIAEENQTELGVTFDRRQGRRNGSVSDVADLALSLHHQKTFTVTSDENIRSSSVENITRNVTVTIKDNLSLCSMPNLHEESSNVLDGDDDEAGKIFQEHEIRAQSSRFNLHELGRFSDEMVLDVRTLHSITAAAGCKRGLVPADDAGWRVDRAESMFESEISPPKRLCRLANTSSTSIASHRFSTEEAPIFRSARRPIGYKAVQGRNVSQSSSRNLILKRPALPSTLPVKGEEKRIFLYDSNRHLKTLINADPFAATTTRNPFLCPTMYLDQRGFEQYERQMKKWLNALVSIPADLDTEPNKPLDVGKLFDEVKCKELTLAPTKELISSNYYKNRLNSLRSAGIALYMSEELSMPLRKVAAQIEKHQLTLRTDRTLHLDLVLQRTVLELLLCFNPLWLRLGLEVVFGEQIELQSNRDIVGLSSFIVNRLFRDRYLEARNSKAYNLSSVYAEHMRKFTLRMVLFMLLFLDTAKRRKLIKHNPCLFARNAPHKETRDILVRFASALVAGIGDITKHLKRVGYTLSHRQSFLDEFDYAFENLAVDLRDGVRLTRVMEIILLREDLSASLRVPPISRLQKIHNINLALGALEQAEYKIAGDISAKDICDGHREQTMSLLWQIVYKFRAPKFNAAASVLQCWWRTNWLKVAISRRIEDKRRLRRDRAARTIQAAVRGYCVRVWYLAMRRQKLRAIVRLQCFVRRYLAQKLAARRFSAIVRIQQWWRSVSDVRHAREHFLLVRSSAIVLQTSYRRYALGKKLQAAAGVIGAIRAEAKHRHQQALVIQRSIKSFFIHRRLQATVHGMVAFIRRKALRARSATKIQSYQRMRTARREYLRMREASICIQRRWRECLEAKRARAHYVQIRTSAIRVQQFFRGYIQMLQARQGFLTTRDLIVRLQRRRRATIAMRNEKSAFTKLRHAAVNVQRRYRAQKVMQLEMHRYESLRQVVITVQRRHRANVAMVQQRQRYESLRVATICVQRRFRAELSMRVDRASYASLRKAALTLQMRYRAMLLMRVEKTRYLQLRHYTIAIQSRYRANVAASLERQNYFTIREAAIQIQYKWRATLEMRRERGRYCQKRNATIVIQRGWRCILLKRKVRQDYIRYRKAAIVLQRSYRALVAGRKVRVEQARRHTAAILIQRKLRATLRTREQRSAFVLLRQTAVNVQRRFRANQARKQDRARFTSLKWSVLLLSNWWAGVLAMRRARESFLRLKNATIVLQRRYRARKVMQKEMMKYERIRAAVLLLQRRYRAHRAMERCRGRFLNMLSASIVVQEFYRGYRQMRIERASYVRLREVTASVQRRYRGKLLMRQQMMEYGRQKAASVAIQRWFRGHRLMVQQRAKFVAIRQASIVLQNRYRGRCAMLRETARFRQLRQATLTIQIRWRATMAMRQERAVYHRTINAVRTIQSRYRAYKERLVQQSSYRIYRSAVIIVQRRYRAKLATRSQRMRFEQVRCAVRGLQRHARGWLARRAFQAMLTPEYVERRRREKAALRIQSWWRGARHRKRFQTTKMRKIAHQMVVSRRDGQHNPANRLSNVMRLCMRFLTTRFSSSEAIGILQRLERMSRLVPHLLVDDAVFLAVFCYNTMAQAIRSELDKILIEICARIILNLARYEGTKEQAFQEKGLVTVSQMLLRWCDKDCGIFSTLCTLLWVLAHDYKKKNAIRRYMISKDAIFMLRETKKLVQRKEKMRKNVQRPIGCLVAPSPQLMRTVPSLEADFGVNRSKPYLFYSSVFGFERVLHILEVDLS